MTSGQAEKDGRGTGLTVTTAAFVFLVLRLFAVSGYDWHTAFAVLHTVDPKDAIGLVLGTVMADSLASLLFLTLLAPIAVLRLLMEVRTIQKAKGHAPAQGQRPEQPGLTGAMALLVSLVAVVAYINTFHRWWLLLLVAAVGGLMLVIAHSIQAGGRLMWAAVWAARHLGLLAAAAMLFGAATVRTPWVPLERIELRGGTDMHGYVLQAEPGFLKVLTEHRRHLLILPDRDVSARREIAEH
ncbi:hypothetical protein AB0I54_36350 [Streptomyces sp. NPDC050625]|uniref:hypothetical protein n=1 Tax=Streptomyces sp. NPDC050625 TaxID=3154629 RepID=UPI0034207695